MNMRELQFLLHFLNMRKLHFLFRSGRERDRICASYISCWWRYVAVTRLGEIFYTLKGGDVVLAKGVDLTKV